MLVVSSEGVTPRLFAGIGKIELRVQDVLSTPGHPPKAGASLSSIGRADRPNTGALSLDTKEWSMASRIRSERRWPLESGQRVSASGRNKWGILRESGFDVCICELSEADLLRSSEIVNAIASGLPTGGSIFLFHWNREMGRLELAEKLVEANALAFDFPSHLYSGRTMDRADAIRLWDSGFAALRGIGIFRQLGGVLQIARAMWSALGVNLRGDAVEFNQLPDACTSVTIELEVTP